MFRKSILISTLIFFCGGTIMAAEQIELPKPRLTSKISIEEAISRRRSERSYKATELRMDQISQLLWAAQGITDNEFGFRAAPSAGSLYPLSLYLVKKDGVFRYIPDGHKLVKLMNDDVRPSLTRAALGQSYIREAPINIVVAGNFNITQAKYGVRAFRYVCMEIGHVAENIALQAVAMGLDSVTVGAFWDDVIKKTLNLPDTQEPLYIIPIGYKNLDVMRSDTGEN